jgi:hypothetical protein
MNELPNNYYNAANFQKKELGKEYTTGRVEPDALEYAKFFYAKNHIPGIQNRPGNNSYSTVDIYKRYLDNYNLQCYN